MNLYHEKDSIKSKRELALEAEYVRIDIRCISLEPSNPSPCGMIKDQSAKADYSTG
jgi:hypothetical protein